MAKFTFPQFLKNHGIKLFFSSVEDTVPGAIIKKRKRGFFPIGTIQQVLGGGSAKWATKLQSANFAQGTIERNLSLKGKTSLDEFGVNVEGGLKHASSVNFQITDVKARTFESESIITFWDDIFKIRDTNPQRWKMINNCWLADHVYYASEMKVTFKVDASINLKGDIENRVKVSGDAAIEWDSNRSFTITKNKKVPFGFSARKI